MNGESCRQVNRWVIYLCDLNGMRCGHSWSSKCVVSSLRLYFESLYKILTSEGIHWFIVGVCVAESVSSN